MPAPFSETVMEHFLRPRHAASLPAPDGEGWSGSVESGRYMRIQVRVRDGRVIQAGFGTSGCAPAIAAGSWLTEWATGRAAADVFRADAAWLRDELGGLPEARAYCADLAVEALQAAVRDARTKEEATA